MSMKVLHIIQCLTGGGAARSLIATAKYSQALGVQQEHTVIVLTSVGDSALNLAKEYSVRVLLRPSLEAIQKEIQRADIVNVHFWNTPELFSLLRQDLPPMRLAIWLKVIGDKPPHILTPALVEFADVIIPTSPHTLNNPSLNADLYSYNILNIKPGVVYGIADFDRLTQFQKKNTSTFNVGYIGTLDLAKIHPNFIDMSASIRVPNLKIIVGGYDNKKRLVHEANRLGATQKFDFRGYVEDIASILQVIDVFGYPLCEDTYATSEKSLQEAMFVGIPPVVFPYGGVKHLVENNKTGLVVHSALEYRDAIEYLYHNPAKRQKLGENAKLYAQTAFNPECSTQKINNIYDTLMQQPKRKRSWNVQKLTFLQNSTGCGKFIESLGSMATDFIKSLSSNDLQSLFDSDKSISRSSPLLHSSGSGGILHYRLYYPNDAYLRLWSGLVFRSQGQLKQAAYEFYEAVRLGFPHWRIFWYFAETAVQIGQLKLAEEALKKVMDSAPDFHPAKKLLDQISMSLQLSQTSQVCFATINPLVSDLHCPFWSVMIPTYKKLEYLEQTLQSVLQQLPESHQVQVEVVNDNPDRALQDEMEALVKRVGGDRVSFYRHTENDIGQTAIFNLCIERAKGDWVHLLHDDDLVLPGFYQALEPVLSQNSQIGAAFCRHRYIDENDKELFLSPLERETPGILENWLDKIIVSQRIQPSSIVVKRKAYETLGGFCAEAKSAADWEMWKRISVHFPVWYEPQVLACYRLHSLSWSSRLIETGGNIADTRAAIQISQSYLPAGIASTLSSQALEHYAQYALREAQKQLQLKNPDAAQAQIKEALNCSQSPQVQSIANHLLKACAPGALPSSPALTNPSAFLNQVSTQLNTYQQNPHDSQALETLRQLRQELAQACLELPPEKIIDLKNSPLAQAHSLLKNSVLKYECD